MSRSLWSVPKKKSPLRTVSFPVFGESIHDKELDEVSAGYAKTGSSCVGDQNTLPPTEPPPALGQTARLSVSTDRGKGGRRSRRSRRTTERQPRRSPRLDFLGDDFDDGDSVDESSGSTGSGRCRNDICGAVSKATNRRQQSTEPFSSSSRPIYGPDEADIPERAMDRRQQSPERVSTRSKSIHGFDDVIERERAWLVLKYARATLRATTGARAVSPPFTPFWPRSEINLPSVRPKQRRFGPAKRVTFDGLTSLTKSAGVRASRPRRRSAIEVIARVKPKLILKRPDTLTEGSSPSPLQTDVALQAMPGTDTYSGSTNPSDEWPDQESQRTLKTEDPKLCSKQWREGLASCWKGNPSTDPVDERPNLESDPVDEWPNLESQSTLETENAEVCLNQWKKGLAPCWKGNPSSPENRFTEASGPTKSTPSIAESPPASDPPPTILDSLYEGTRIWSNEASLGLGAHPNTHKSLELPSSGPKLSRCKLVSIKTQHTDKEVKTDENFDVDNGFRPQFSADHNIDPRLKDQPYVSIRELSVLHEDDHMPKS